MRAPLAALVLAGLAYGCSGPHRLVAARHTPCRTRDIEISEVETTPTSEHWIATCEKGRFVCRTREVDGRLRYGCRPEVPHEAARPPTNAP